MMTSDWMIIEIIVIAPNVANPSPSTFDRK